MEANIKKRKAPGKIRKLLKNKLTLIGLIIVFVVIIAAVFADFIAPHPDDVTGSIDFSLMNQPPSGQYLFGTDEAGRDIFSRVLFGARYSLVMGVIVLTVAIVIGVPLGLIAGFWGGKVNAVIMRLTDIFLSIPSIILAMAVAAIMEPSLINSMVAISFGWWPWFTRLVQAETLKIKNEQFILASEGIGASKWRIAFIEILPNCLSTIIVKASTDIGFVILTGASLGFLGLGAQPPAPEWGTMVAEGRVYLPTMWWQTTFPGLAILVTVLGFNLLGDGLRDYFDVKVD
ncbi:ABC transporter permease [Enterococcus saccharolyticus]|uniref:D-ala-D-ala transporter subunit n=1 Tax=Candidatus Enterococcus willemsii TaxID=1857215 RepID=A0ABQ6YZY1_9ENTE|nr:MULTISPECIES: ABC transporter permease [Enterococcus]KAF1303614.1 D-ala-D-ala transporter subunit [Enterococcus sp. CU12B]MCD5001664.1 ABC transporter permease [Enterococcus saccharolyticus]